MAAITPQSAASHRSATANDPADPEIIAGRQVVGDAWFSDCCTWRYRLSRRWQGGSGTIMWLMLNPSTADAVRVDPTVRRAVTFSMGWGFAEALVGNVFSLRATSPKHLYDHADPIGPENDKHLRAMAGKAQRIVLAWGNHALHGGRSRGLAGLLREHADRCVHLALTASGMPKHPLYISGAAKPVSARELVLKHLDAETGSK